MKAALGRARQGLRLGVGAQQGEIDGAGGTLVAVVEQGQAPVAGLEHAQHRRHALDGEHELARPLAPRGFQRDAQIAEIAQHRELHGGAALDMAAIGQKLARQGAGELLQPGGQQPLMAEGQRPQDQALHPGEQGLAGEAARQGMGEMAGLALHRLGEAKLEGAHRRRLPAARAGRARPRGAGR